MKKVTVKTIEIAGYLSEKESSKGKTALWFDGIEEVLDYVVDDYSFTDEEIESELVKAQEYLDAKVKENDWVITPKAYINVHEFEIEEEEENA